MADNYLNKIGLLKYNNTTYKPIEQPQYYKVRNPQLVSTSPDVDYLNFLFKFSQGWEYNNFGKGWTYTGKDDIAYEVQVPIYQVRSYNPKTLSSKQNDAFVYNKVYIHPYILSSISGDIVNSTSFQFPSTLYVFEQYQKYVLENAVKWVNTESLASAVYSNLYIAPSTFILTGAGNLIGALNYDTKSSNEAFGYIVENQQITGVLSGAPFIDEGGLDDIFQNVLYFDVKSPNINKVSERQLESNAVEGIFKNIPGTNYVSGICTTNMYFTQNQKVLMRGIFYGTLDLQNGVINEIASGINDIIPNEYNEQLMSSSVVIRKIRIKDLKGVLKNVSHIPESLKYNIDSYYAWGWLYGIGNIKYTHVWYKNEISGLLQAEAKNIFNDTYSANSRYRGNLSTTIITNDGTQDIKNILTGTFVREKDKNIISGYLEGDIKPYDIHMKGYLTGYYSQVGFKYLKPLQLSGILYNTSTIDNNLRTILDIKEYNTLGRKGLSYPHSLQGQNLDYASKNYDYFNKPYMLQSWKIIEYKVSLKNDVDFNNSTISRNSIDLNTYIVDNKYTQQYRRSKIRMTNQDIQNLNINPIENKYYVYWQKLEDSQYKDNFAIIYTNKQPSVENYLQFEQKDAQKYIKHLCSINNLKLKDCLDLSTQEYRLLKFVIDSSDLEII